MLRAFVADPLPSDTRTLNEGFPAVCGVPEIAPEELNKSPAGSEPKETVHVYEPDPPVAVSDAE